MIWHQFCCPPRVMLWSVRIWWSKFLLTGIYTSRFQAAFVISVIPRFNNSNSKSKYSDLLLMIKFNLASSIVSYLVSSIMMMLLFELASSFLRISSYKSLTFSSSVIIITTSSMFMLHFWMASFNTVSGSSTSPKNILTCSRAPWMSSGS